jgi:hypothetical protein
MVNKMRIATNLATNEFTWHLLTQVPQLQPVLKKYSSAHAKGLEEIAKNLAETTCGSTEAEQFLDALREVLQTGKLKINDKRGYTKEENGFACHFDGWWENGNLCISPEIVTNLLKKHTSLNDNNVSKQTLYRQLEALGAIADRNRNEPTKNFNIGGEPCRALVLKWSAVKYECVDPEEDSGGGYDTVF